MTNMPPAELGLPPSITQFRPTQWDLITKIAASDKRYIILEAPTGVGKSVIAAATAGLLGGQAHILTGQKQLQDQYATMLEIPTVRGRANFPCITEPGVKADAAVCSVGGPCKYKPIPHKAYDPGCPYYDQKLEGMIAPMAVLNYAYWLAQVNYAGAFNSSDLLICDEAHVLEEELRRFSTVTFRRTTFKFMGMTFPRAGDDLTKWKRWATKSMPSLNEQLRLTGRSTAYMGKSERREVSALTSLRDACAAILDPSLPDDGWTLRENIYGVEARPVWISPLLPRIFHRHLPPKVVFMSATILSGELFAHQLGIPTSQIEFIQAPCPFPKKNRPIHYMPVGRVNKDIDYDALVEGIDAVLDKHPEERGLIHTVSYKLARIIIGRSRHTARMLTHDTSGAKNTALADFHATPGAVLVSPSVTTGVDLPYDLCRFQVIAKLAFPDLGDPQIKKRMKLGPDGEPDPLAQRWYSWSAACALVQAYGRGVRAEDDACVTYLLDGNWKWFRHSIRDMIPDWFNEAFVKPTNTNTVRVDDIFPKSSAIPAKLVV